MTKPGEEKIENNNNKEEEMEHSNEKENQSGESQELSRTPPPPLNHPPEPTTSEAEKREGEDIIDLNASRETITTIEDDTEADKTITQETKPREKTRNEASGSSKNQATKENTPISTEQDRYRLRNTQSVKYKELNEGRPETEQKAGKRGRAGKGKKTDDNNEQKKTPTQENTEKHTDDQPEMKEILKETKDQLKTTQKILMEERKSMKAWKEDKMRLEKEIVILRKALARSNEEIELKDKYIEEYKTNQGKQKEEFERLKKRAQ